MCCAQIWISQQKKSIIRINYDPSIIEKALKAIKDTGLSLRKAAAAYGVPVATLGRKKILILRKLKIKQDRKQFNHSKKRMIIIIK